MTKQLSNLWAGFVLTLIVVFSSNAQEYNSFEIRYQNNIKGDLTFIGNQIVNRDAGVAGQGPNNPYNNFSTDNSNYDRETGGHFNYNDYKNMQYIDVDGDASTFSSSTATLSFPNPNCNLIRYAGLYWSATYPSETANGSYDGSTYSGNTVPVGTNRQTDFNQVKFMVPGGAYVDITADEVLFDGSTSGDSSVTQNSPYACYADVTSLVTALANPEGDYTVANIRSVTGSLTPGGGAAGGWTLVIVYENPTLPGRLISTFDGFARVNGSNSVDISYNGFNTIPAGPVNADIGVASLEGDFRISGDGMSIQAASSGSFTTISNATTPADNFFNSNITLDGVITTNRNPDSQNTLGYDTDIFLLNNPANAVIPNGETSATFRFSTNGDQYYPFFNSFSVEIIEPNIVLEKKVEDIGGNDITGLGVNLGQYLDYVLSFVNTGNDDATNYTIRDILPINVTLDELNISLPTGVTYVYDSLSREITFTIPDNLVEVGDPVSEIRMRVRVAENCFDFIDACTDQIENVAYSTYEGIINDNQITDDPSVSDFDDCGFTTPGATNFLLDDLENCNYTRTVQLCGDDVLLDAGDNFDAYVWVRDTNGDGQIDGGDEVLNDGDPDGDPSTLLVDRTGTYIVNKQVADPCKDFNEIIIVELFGTTQTNPITALINDTSNTVEGEVVVCPNDGEELPQVFLCGLNDTELIQINIPDADSIVWEQLDDTSCAAATPDCANLNNTCTWNTVATGSDFLAQDAGEYRLVINYQNGCFSRFYFNIFKNPLDPQYNSSDIVCATPGNITVTNMPADYEYQLLDATNGNILVAYQNSPSFDITTNGAYAVEMRQSGVSGGCVFLLDNIGILERNFQVDVTTRDTDCNGLGEISISVLDVNPQYTYEISQGGASLDTYGPSNDNNHTFQNLNPGTYEIDVTTDDGCTFTNTYTINDVTDLALTALTTKQIDCLDGEITLTATGGNPNPNYNYAIWSVDGTPLYADLASIPGGAYQTSNLFTFTAAEAGDYVFVVVDGNNCPAYSNSVSITEQAAVDYTTSLTNQSCFGVDDGSYTVNVTNSNGYTLSYLLTFPDNSTQANTSGVFTGLPQGGFVLTITQTQGAISCDFIEPFSIGGPTAPISGTLALIQEYTCTQNAVVQIQNPAGGIPPYEYSIDGINFVSGLGSDTFGNLTPGTYNGTIRDTNGCLFLTNAIVIDPLTPPSDLSFTATTPTCPTQEADIEVTVTDGEAPFVFEIISPSAVAATSISGNQAQFNSMTPGTYLFRVTDNNGCTYDESFTLNPVSPIQVTGQLISNISCLGDTDGAVRFTVSDFVASYDYVLSGPSGSSVTAETNGTLDFTGLAAGTYTLNVTDSDSACTATASVTVQAPAAALTISASADQPTCLTDGNITLTSTGGWGGNTFDITYPDAVTTASNATGLFTALPQTGTYSVSVTDSNGCVVSTTIDLTAPTAPVLAITPNDYCYDDAVGLILTASVTSGGDGNFEYSLNGGVFQSSPVFAGLVSGTYSIEVRDGNDCTDTASITINPELELTASADPISACGASTSFIATATGGDGNYVYALVADGVTPVVGDFGASASLTANSTGDFDVYVRDQNGGAGYCEVSFDISITQDPALGLSVVETPILCSGDLNGALALTASGGEAPYEYSSDGGSNYQSVNTFTGLGAGNYNLRIRDANGCTFDLVYTLSEPFTLSASAAVTELAECNPGIGAEVRITNAQGGTAPYEYSFDGGSTYGTTAIANLLAGTHNLIIRDANGCTFPMTLTVEPEPNAPDVTAAVTYECDGEGVITLTPSSGAFDYTYELDGVPNTPASNNVFSDVAPGNYTVTVNYTVNTPPSQSTLMSEDFGAGANTPITEIDPAYCYEPQDGTASLCGFGTDTHIQDGEYSVTNLIVNPYGSWRSPNDHSGLASGRFLAINVGGVAGVGGIVYQKTGVEVIPNQDVTVSLWAYNILRVGSGGGDPSIEIQLVDSGGAVIASTTTGNVPKNNNADDWHNYTVSLNPGANSNLDIVIRTNSAITAGNDIAIDDIQAFQVPQVCSSALTIPVTVDPGNAFDASVLSSTDISCFGGADGAIRFEIENFDAVNGFEYQINGGGFSVPQFTSPIDLTGLTAGAYTIEVRDVLDTSCSITLNATLNEPPALLASASITDEMTCLNGGATITASASGGTTAYQFELQDGLGTVLVAFQSSPVFTGLTAGDYLVRVQDANGCIDPIDAVITVNAPQTVAFTLAATSCYSGANDGTVDVTVTGGNGDYEFRLNGGAWIVPSPSTSTTHSFSSLSAGTYSVEVRDGYGCVAAPQNITIDPVISATTDVVHLSSCANGSISVTATGGDGNLEYAFVPIGGDPSGLFSTTSTFTVTAGNDGDYDVYVRDNNATVPYCEWMATVTVNPAIPIAFTTTPSDPQCHDGLGSIDLNISSGSMPFTLNIIDLDNGGAANQTINNHLNPTYTFFNLQPGDYTVQVTDSFGCTLTDTPISINNPDELTATVQGITPATCGGPVSDFGFEFVGYPTTLGTIEFSADGGASWVGDNSVPGTTDRIMGIASGTTVYPSMRTVDGLGNTLCQTDLPPFIIPYPLDDLDISISAIVVNCNDLQVTVLGSEGTPNYQYTYTDDPANFNPAAPTIPWSTPATDGSTPRVFTGLIPGRTYVFYVRDAVGCVRESNVNVNDLITVPLDITSTVTPTCNGGSTGELSYTVTDNQAPFESQFRWELYDMSSGAAVLVTDSGGILPYTSPQTVTITGLPAGNYFFQVWEVDGANLDSCVGATENELLDELDALSGTPSVLQNISCNTPGLIQVVNPLGGGGIYTYTVTGPVPFVTITATGDNPIQIPANSPAGTYSVSMQDQYGCSVALGDVNLTLTPDPTIDNVVVDNCDGLGLVTVTASSPAASIFYSLDGGTNFVNNGGAFAGIAPGTYTLVIQDSNGCTDTASVTVHPPLQAQVTLTKLMDCSVSPDAEITLDLIDGSGDYDYEVADSGGTIVARTALPSDPFVLAVSAADTYTITVFDNLTDTPCTEVFTVVVPPIVNPSFVATPTDVSCQGSTDGSIEMDASASPITIVQYTLTPGALTTATNRFDNLAPGTYTVTAEANNGCTFAVTNIVIGEPAPIVLPAAAVTEFSCASGNNPDPALVSINSASITGGSGSYVIYEFVDTQGTPGTGDDVVLQSGSSTSLTVTNTAGVDLIINVYDSNACLGSTTAAVQPFDELQALALAISNPLSCAPGTDGEITATATTALGNPAVLEYSIDGGAVYQASNVFSGLVAGTYTVLVRHTSTGCVVSNSITLDDPNTFSIDLNVLSNVVCFGTNSGSVEISLVDATYVGPFTYTIYNTQGTPTNFADDTVEVTGTSPTNGPFGPIALAGGDYYVEVVQDNFPACTQIEAFSIASPSAAITANTQLIPISCLGNDGQISITDVLGGWGGYTYYAGTTAPTGPGDYQASATFTGLAPGTYQSWVLDSAGCEQLVQTDVLANPTPISATLQINQDNCTNFNGEIEVVGVSGGAGANYTYQLFRNTVAVGSPQTSPVFSGLGAGQYEVLVADPWSCTFTTADVFLYDEINLTANVIKPLDCSATPEGEITITATGGSTNLEYTVTFPDGLTTQTNTTGVFTLLPDPGTYTFVVSDLDTGLPQCQATITANLVAPTPVTLDPSVVQNVSCAGGSDGSIEVVLETPGPGVNDDPAYTYSLYDAAGTTLLAGPQSSPVFGGLVAGSYQVEAISSKSCTARTTVTVSEPTPLTTSATATAFVCNAVNTTDPSVITVTAAGGTAPYQYSLDNINFQTANTFVLPDTGVTQNLSLFVLDQNGCSVSTNLSLEPRNTFSLAINQQIAISCVNPEQVEVVVTDNGSPSNAYTFELLPLGNTQGSFLSSPSSTTAEFAFYQPGSYTIRVTDTATGCYVDSPPYVIAPYDLAQVSAVPQDPVICAGDGSGSLTYTISGFSGSYDYEVFFADGTSTGISGSDSVATQTISGLNGGSYYIEITQTAAPFCTSQSGILTMAAPDVLLITNLTEESSVGCPDNQGEVLATASGGYPPYDFVLTHLGTGQVYTANDVQEFVFTGLSGGDYTLDVTDDLGCVESDTITLVTPTPIVANVAAAPSNLQCFGDTDGVITTAVLSGGVPPFQYQLNQYDATGTSIAFQGGYVQNPVFTDLGAGIYSVTVADGYGCVTESAQVVITEPTEILGSLIQVSPLSCTNMAQIELTASGGSAPYEYSEDGITYLPMSGGNVHSFAVNAGRYQYYIRDAFGCLSMISNEVEIDVLPPLAIDLDLSAAVINCTGESTALISARATGGLGNYQYRLYGDAAFTSLLAGPQAEYEFAGLPAGSYWVEVVSGDCVEATNEIIITDPAPLQVIQSTFTDVSCNGMEDGTITVEVSGGTGEIFYAISPNLNQFDTQNTFTDLAPGIYNVLAQDRNGCFIPFQFTIGEPAVLDISTVQVLDETCQGNADGAVQLQILGGTAPFRTSWNSNQEADFTDGLMDYGNLPSGTHVFFVRDARDCEANILVEIEAGVNLNATVAPIYYCSGDTPESGIDLIMEDPSVLPDVLYGLDTLDPASFRLDTQFGDISPGVHTLTIAHANGCINTVDFQIRGFEPLSVVMTNDRLNEFSFAAAGGSPAYRYYVNGVETTETTQRITQSDTYEVRVVDQNGCESVAALYVEYFDIELPDYFSPDGDGMNETWAPINQEAFPEILTLIFDRYGREIYRMELDDNPWDGLYNNTELPSGDYWYVIKLRGENDKRQFVGHFTLYR
jgi:gliding motility-associated-like protein/uncharacterized repeat protein (TIGR01451 family)